MPDILNVDIWYPTVSPSNYFEPSQCRAVNITLVCVRAANSLHIEFSHDRNGWVVSMPAGDWSDELDCFPLHEVAFIDAWAVE